MKDLFDAIFNEFQANTAIVFNDRPYSYSDLQKEKNKCLDVIIDHQIQKGEVVALYGDFTPVTIGFLIALIENQNIIVPFVYPETEKSISKSKIAMVSRIINIDSNEQIKIEKINSVDDHDFYISLRNDKSPGLVLFTSGTSGEPKGAVHNFNKLLEKFKTKRKSLKTINFLLFDHWGGLNTLFHTLSNGGIVLALNKRDPKSVCEYIEKHRIELLPASPTFLNLLLISEEYKNFNLESLKLITYGTEPMPQSTLSKLKEIFPSVKLQQTYGLIELGVLRSKSLNDESLWVKIGGEGYQTRVVNDMLEIKADSAMLGYLNAESPFTSDGWFQTKDKVEVNGEYFKILGRISELINVGGEKVYPAEVESVILEMSNVAEVTVFSEKNAIVGNIVCAKVRLIEEENQRDFISRLKIYCKGKLSQFMIPVRIIIDNTPQFNERFKKTRN
jgi:acyl-CoA synthetase (AMP-forming)/AMP-acid ligase II